MNNVFSLTLRELHLVQIVTGRGPFFPGLEEFELNENSQRPGTEERDGLAKKGILVRNGEGHWELDRTAGYLFDGIVECDAFLQGQLLWKDGKTARYNIYLVDTGFVVVFAGSRERIEFMYISALPMLIGGLVYLLHHEDEYRARTKQSEESCGAAASAALEECRLEASENELSDRFIAVFEAQGARPGWSGSRYAFLMDEAGDLYSAEGEETFRKATEVEALLPVNRKIAAAHIEEIRKSGVTDEQ